MLSEILKKKTVPFYKHKLYIYIYIYILVYQIINISLVCKLKKWQANADYIAKVSIEGW